MIGATAVIGPDVQIGRDCAVGPGASVVHALIGDGVILHAGCRIGQDGFRYHPSANGHVKVPQLGRVIIQDNVEIGANTAIDRGGIGDTVIGEGTKIDNLVQIGHNCQIGRHCIIVALCGLSGSVVLGDFAVLGGQVGVADHITIGEGAKVGAQSGVMSHIPAGEQWLGYPGDAGQPVSPRHRDVAQANLINPRGSSAREVDAIRGDDPRRLPDLAQRDALVAEAVGLEIRPSLLRALGPDRADVEPVAFAAVDRRAGNHLAAEVRQNHHAARDQCRKRDGRNGTICLPGHDMPLSNGHFPGLSGIGRAGRPFGSATGIFFADPVPGACSLK